MAKESGPPERGAESQSCCSSPRASKPMKVVCSSSAASWQSAEKGLVLFDQYEKKIKKKAAAVGIRSPLKVSSTTAYG